MIMKMRGIYKDDILHSETHKIVEYIPIGRPHLIICAFDVVESKQFLKFLEIIY